MMKLLTQCISRFSQAKQLQYPVYNYAKDIPASEQRTHWDLFKAVNSALDIALETDPTYLSIYTEPNYSDRMLNLEVFFDAQSNSARDMELTESSILLFPNKEF